MGFWISIGRTMRIGEERSSPRVSVRRRRRACTLGVDVADDAEGSSGDEGVNEVQPDEGSPTVEMVSSISSRTRVERRLERRWSSGFDVVLELLQKKFEGGVRGVRRFKA
jgi:hypothetical protein